MGQMNLQKIILFIYPKQKNKLFIAKLKVIALIEIMKK